MKKIQFLSFLVILFSFSACKEVNKKSKVTRFTLTNKSNQPRKDAIFILSGHFLDTLAVSSHNFKITQGDKIIAYQLDDLNGDGQIDEMLILDDFKANETKQYLLSPVSNAAHFKPRTNIHFAYKDTPEKEMSKGIRLKAGDAKKSTVFQMEGPAWENDKVAFRNYFDARNGIDIFGKQTKKLVLDKVGIEGQNYHELSDWGMDILKVGASLGAGAIALMKGDSIYRIDSGQPATFELVKEGPLRSIFDLKFKDFTIDNHPYQITHRITIEAGKNYYQSDVTVHGLSGDETLVTGIVNLHSDSLTTFSAGNMKVLLTHDRQSENKDILGMALLIPAAEFMGIAKAPEKGDGIVSTYMARLRLKNDKPVRFYFFSGWERQHKDFKNMESFKKSVRDAAENLQHAIQFEIP